MKRRPSVGLTRSLECRSFPYGEDLELRSRDFRASLPIRGRYKRVARPFGVVCKLFPYRDTWVENMQKVCGASVFNRWAYTCPFVGLMHFHPSGSYVASHLVDTHWPVRLTQKSQLRLHVDHVFELMCETPVETKCVAPMPLVHKEVEWGVCPNKS